MNSKKITPWILFIGVTAILIYLWTHLKQSDPPSYFNFADQRTVFGIPCFGDVLSNLAFLFVGLWGLRSLRADESGFLFKKLLSTSIIATAVGSSYFHWNPNPATLVWDRIPMCAVFGIVIGWVIADKINKRVGLLTAAVLTVAGIFSLFINRLGFIDLRFYYLLQYGGLVFVLLTCFLVRLGRYSNTQFLIAFGFYIVAKIFEREDYRIYKILFSTMSGHTLKHLMSAVAIAWLLKIQESKS